MKKAFTFAIILGLGGGLYAAREALYARPAASDTAAGAAQLAAEPMPDAPLEKLGRPELDQKIAEIDAAIEREHLVERSNRGQLTSGQLKDLRRRLNLRNHYFLRKIELDSGQS
jgi:hypothetical protein